MGVSEQTPTVLIRIDQSNLSDADKSSPCRYFILTEKTAATMTPGELREARELAGLSPIQAAELLGIHRVVLLTIAVGPLDEPVIDLAGLLARMDEAYGLGEMPVDPPPRRFG